MDSPTNEKDKIVNDVLQRHNALSEGDKRKYSSDVETFVNDFMMNKAGTSKSIQKTPSSKKIQSVDVNDSSDEEKTSVIDFSSTMSSSNLRFGVQNTQSSQNIPSVFVNDSSEEENPLVVDSSSKMSSSLRFGAPQLEKGRNSKFTVEEEKLEFASCVMSRFKSLSPEAKSETRENVDMLVDSLFPSQGSAAKRKENDVFPSQGSAAKNRKEHEDDDDGDAEVDKNFKSSTLYKELVKSSVHGGCDVKAEAQLDLETAVISKKRGRPAHCGSPRCHAYIAVNHHVLIMIGRYGKYFKKVFYCCQDECVKNRNILDCTTTPKKVFVSCSINKKEKTNLLKDFPNMSQESCPSCR